MKAALGLFSACWGYIRSEPVAAIAVVDGALMLAVAFGAPITPTEKGAADVFLGAVGTLIARSAVTPNVTIAAAGLPLVPISPTP